MKNVNMHVTKVILLTIIAVASLLRLIGLSGIPSGFHGDEASIGYNAYSMLRTGRDQNNVFLPLVIDQWGDYRPAGYHYLTVPSVALFGLNEFAVRFPSALVGILMIVLMFYLAKAIFEDDTTGLIAAAVTALSPWHLVVSRATSEGIVALALTVSGSIVLLQAYRKKNPTRYLVASAILFILTQLFYHAARLFVPLYVIFVAVFCVKVPQGSKRALAFVVMAIIAASALIFLGSSGEKRLGFVSIFSENGTRLVLEEQIREDGFQDVRITKFFHNKPAGYVWTVARNYLDYFSTKFLFVEGGFPFRYSVPGNGMLFIFDALFLVIGFSLTISRLRRGEGRGLAIPLVWLIIGPLPAAITFEDIPNVQRSIFMLPGLILLLAYGYREFFSSGWARKLKFPLLIVGGTICLYYILVFFHNYFHHTKVHKPYYRAVSERELTTKLRELSGGTIPILATADGDNVQIFYLFYWKIDPSYYHSLGFDRQTDIKSLGNITFTGDPCPMVASTKNTGEPMIYVNRAFCAVPPEADELAFIKRPDGSDDYRILKFRDQGLLQD